MENDSLVRRRKFTIRAENLSNTKSNTRTRFLYFIFLASRAAETQRWNLISIKTRANI